ncbi:MAG: GntR family transcriptional regulator [Leifsonia xyli]|nr:MAG: GntR family transcriptional regulator [Leifsonia xyli]
MTNAANHWDARRGPNAVSPSSRKEAVRTEIRRAIIEGALTPGQKLTEMELAAALKVSRPTLREALNQLAREGLLIQEPYRGLHVAEVTHQEMRDIARVRLHLDSLAIDEILADESGERLSLVESGWERFRSAALDPDPVVQHDAHVAFHRQIWAASGNFLLLKLWPVTEAHLTLALAEDQATRSDPPRALRLHEKLMTAIRTRDRAVIHDALVHHTIDSAEDLIAQLSQAEIARHGAVIS